MILGQRQILNSLNTNRSDGLGNAFIWRFISLVYRGALVIFIRDFTLCLRTAKYFGPLSALTAEELI